MSVERRKHKNKLKGKPNENKLSKIQKQYKIKSQTEAKKNNLKNFSDF